jgi:hypothetical protein
MRPHADTEIDSVSRNDFHGSAATMIRRPASQASRSAARCSRDHRTAASGLLTLACAQQRIEIDSPRTPAGEVSSGRFGVLYRLPHRSS